MRLVFLAHVAKKLDGFLARHDRARNLLVLRGQFHHFFLDRFEIFRGKRLFVGEVIVKAVFDHRSDRNLGFRKQLLYGLCQQVGGRMPDHFEPFRVPIGNNRQLGIFFDDIGGIDESSIDLAGQGGLGQSGTDR